MRINWANTISAISILVALGAYSSDSLFVSVFKSNNIFSIVESVNDCDTTITRKYCQYQSFDGSSKLTPISSMLHVYLKNESSEDQRIVAVKIELETGEDDWKPLDSYIEPIGIYESTSRYGLKKMLPVDFKENLILDNLSKDKIKPNDVVSGWFVISSPKHIKGSNTCQNRMRITLYSGFGKHETHVLDYDNSTYDSDATPTTYASYKRHSSSTQVDLSAYEVISLYDLRKRDRGF